MISRNTNVERSEIYRIMASLGKMGLIEKTISLPVKFKPASIREAVFLLMSNRINETLDLNEKAEEMLREFKVNKLETTFTGDETQFTIILKKQASLQRRRKAIENSQKTIDVLNSSKRFPATTFAFGEEIMKALRRGLRSE
jgi:sugar-specific transcriptional regulator TrmB